MQFIIFYGDGYGMVERRTQMKAIGTILTTTRDEMQDRYGVSITHLVRQVNMPHTRISNILNNLVSQGLLEQADSH